MNCSFKSLLAAVLLLCSTVATAHDFEVGGIFYNITSSTGKTVEVTFKGDSYYEYSNEYTGDVTVPSTVAYNGNTYSVTSIGGSAFYECSGLTSIEIPGSVTSIGGSAFYECSGLTSIEIPGSVTSIGEYAFSKCSGFTSIEIPGSVTSIGERAFYYCDGLTSVTIGDGVTSIGEYAFWYCSGLKSIEIPGSVTSIGIGAFSQCSGLTSVTIGDGVTSIGDWAFYGCSGLTSIEIPGSVTSIGDYAFYECRRLTSIEIPGSVTSIGNYAFRNCKGLTSVTIGDGVTSIGECAFSACFGLTSIEIPGSVTSIGNNAFEWCSGLTSVTSLATTAPALGSSVFSYISSDATLYYPAGSDYSSWAQYFANTEEFEIAEQPIYFSDYNGLPGSMQGNNHVWESGKISLSRVTNGIRITVFATNSPDSYNGFPVVALGELEFYNANGEKIDYTAADVTTNSLESTEGSLKGLCDGDYSTFYHSTWRSGTEPSDYVYVDVRFAQPLDAVNIKIVGRNTGRLVPTHIGITSSGVYCPYLGTEGSCGDNARWSLENGVLTISGTGAMWDYYLGYSLPWPLDEITHVIIEDGVTSIGNYAFFNCGGLTSVTISDGVTSIGEYAFYSCSGLTSVTIGDGVTSIGKCAFMDCDGLTSVTIGDGVTSIGEYAFRDCDGLTSVTIGDGVTSIGYGAFAGCDRLTSVTIGDGVTSIGGFAFSNCSGLTSIEIPGSVTSIGDDAFSYCSGLTSVTSLATTAPALGSYAFDRISSDATLYYPADSDYSSWAQYFANTETIYVQSSKCGDNLTWNIHGGVLTISGTGAMWDYAYNNSAPWSSDEITHVIIEDGVTSIGGSAFLNCYGLTSIEIPGSVTSIGEEAFSGCTGLTSVTIPNSVTSIGGWAFEGCAGLTAVHISDLAAWCNISFANYNSNPLYKATNLYLSGEKVTSLDIPWGVTSIKPYVFRDFFSLTSVTIPGSVTSIGEGSFRGCIDLASVVIPNSVTSIGDDAFYDCYRLTSVTSLATTAPALGSAVFSYISSDATLYFPAGSDYSSWAQYFAKMEEIGGDLNGDGTVSVSDIQVLVNLILSDAAAEDNPAADVNSDGTVSVSDIQVVVNIILGN